MALSKAILLYGTRAAQPAASTAYDGCYYRVTDENNRIEQCDGSSWVNITKSGPQVLGTYSAAAAATLPMVTRNAAGQSGALFQTDFRSYVLELQDLVPSSDNVQLYLRLSEDGGATYRATVADYFYHTFWSANTPGSGTFNDSSYVSTAFAIAVAVDTTVASAGLVGVCGEIKLTNPAIAQAHKVKWDTYFYANTPRFEEDHGSGWYTRANAVNACQLLYSGGNITGNVTVIGIP